MSQNQLPFLSVEKHKQWQSVRGWLLESAANQLYQLALASPTGGKIVEIGSYAGKSTICLANAVASRNEKTEKLMAFDIAFQFDFKSNLNRFKMTDFVCASKRSSLEAADTWDHPISFLYIDGHHGKAHAYADLLVWDSFVVENGIVALDDTAGFLPGPNLQLATAIFSGGYQLIGEFGGISFLKKIKSIVETYCVNEDCINDGFINNSMSLSQWCQLSYLSAWSGAFDLDLRTPHLPTSRNENLANKIKNIAQTIWNSSLSSLYSKLIQRLTINHSAPQNSHGVNNEKCIKEIISLKNKFKSEDNKNENNSVFLSLYYLEGCVLIANNKYDAAKDIFEFVLQIDNDVQFPHYAINIRELALLRLANVNDLLEQRERAIGLYQELVTIAKTNEIKNNAQQLMKVPFYAKSADKKHLLREYNLVLSRYRKFS